MALTFLHGLGSVAERYGPEEAVFLHLIVSLARNNKANNRNFRDGRWWTYNSLSAWDEEFPWWSAKQIRRIITSCETQGAILVGEYNEDRRDRTAWYSPSDELLGLYQEDWSGKCICPNGQMHVPKRADSFAQMGTTIPKESKENLQKENMSEVGHASTPDPTVSVGKKAGALPKHKPQRFLDFWLYYPRHVKRDRAVAAWDRLKPSDELIDTMGRALAKQVAYWNATGTELQFIPHAATWINQKRWTDPPEEYQLSGQRGQPSGGWAEDREVL